MRTHLLLIQVILVFWFFCATASSSGYKEKRDIHRIVLKSRKPRHNRDHHHHHSYRHHEPEERKRYKHKHREYEDSDEDNSYEGSFEEIRKPKTHSRHKSYKSRHPYYASSIEHEPAESRDLPFLKNGWFPSTSDESSLSYPHTIQNYAPNVNKENSQYQVELTTVYPYKLVNPQHFIYEAAEAPTRDHLKQKNKSYEVHENHNDEDNWMDQSALRMLAPYNFEESYHHDGNVVKQKKKKRVKKEKRSKNRTRSSRYRHRRHYY